MASMAIKKIATVEQSLLCASIYIHNFKRVIEELVYNSIDAAASSIAIRICIQENFIQVLDNGNGIIKDNFIFLGQKYATSKYVDMSTLKSAPSMYGYRGLCLASIIDVSQNVHIISQYENSNDTWMKTFYNGKEKEICKTISRPSNGTTVEIKGFLYNLSIQRKSIDPHNELLNIKTVLQQLSLVHCNVSISLRDDSKNEIIFKMHKNRTIHDTLRTIYQINVKDLQELQVEKNEYKLKAFVGKNTQDSNNYYQCIYVNGKFIYKSNLHKKFNDSFSNFICKRNNKVNNKHIYEDENYYFNWSVPFYFVFITCPNYGFDLIYNSEKCLVEFKDWKEFNKLIEKLVQFYCGDLVTKKKEVNKKVSVTSKSDKRTEIKEIMEKILDSKKKQTRISQLQNGVKGEILKRNKNKKKDLLVQKVLDKSTNDPCQLRDLPKSPNVEKTIDQLKQQSVRFQKSKDSQIIPNNSINKVSLRAPKIRKSKSDLKTLDKNLNCKDPLIKKFMAPTESVKKRCKYLNRQARKLLDNNIFKQYSGMKNSVYSFINNETQYQTITNNAGNLSLYKKANKVWKDVNIIKVNNSNSNTVKNSYDLIKAVITSQYNMIEKKNTILAHCGQSYGRNSNYTVHESFNMETYNSHYRNFEQEKGMGSFVSATSRNNLFLHEQGILPISKKNNWKETKLPVNNSRKKYTRSDILNKYIQQVQEISHYSIEKSDSYEIFNCNLRGTLYTIDYNLPKDVDHTKLLQFGNTNTSRDFIRSSHGNDNYSLNKTYSLQTLNIPKSYHYFKEVEPIKWGEMSNEIYNGETEKDNFIVPESESDYAEMMASNLEPINYCETVLRSHNSELQDFEKEFEISFIHKRDTITLSNYNFVQRDNSHIEGNLNLNNDLQQSINNFESNQDLYVNSCTVNTVNNTNNCKEIYQSKVDTHMGQHKHLSHIEHLIKDNNFQLRSRHRFMPKGMSPIANNKCELQNAFSGEYYKDVIYKNFANDILLNTEIFEPEAQNVNKLFSKHIEKVNSKIQKQKADLIFDSLSLTQAKILGQVDRKFIASILNGRSGQSGNSSDFLVLFDQHAVDERIRLESNLSDYLQGSDWKSIDIDPVSIALRKDDYIYFVQHRDKLARFGLQWTSTPEYEILLNAIPKAILGKNPRQVEVVVKAVKKLILEQIKAIKSLRGNVSLYPKSIMELVFNEACRYAIKFGDRLSKSECTNMINSLACCKTPFQCAHGRPAIAVLMELNNSNRRSYKVNMTRLKKFKKMSSMEDQGIF